MKQQKGRNLRFVAYVSFCCILLMGTLILSNNLVEAAKKAALSYTEVSIPIGKITDKVYYGDYPWLLTSGQSLSVTNKVKGATYEFKSSNSKIVKVSKDGGYLTGVKAGTATITCTQTYNKKKTTVGKCKVTVKKATITQNAEEAYPIGVGQYNLLSWFQGDYSLLYIANRNPEATYKLESDSKNFTIKEIKCNSSQASQFGNSDDFKEYLKDYIGEQYFYGYEYSATKAGTFTVTVKETYNKKTTTVGKIKIVVKDTELTETEVDLGVGEYSKVFSYLNYARADMNYSFQIVGYDEKDIAMNPVQIASDDNSGELYYYGNKVGTAEVTIKEASENGRVIGTLKINVKEYPCTNIEVEDEYTTYVGYDDFNIYFELEPENTKEAVTIQSDNEQVLKVEYDEKYQEWVYSPLKAGEANVTITCGAQTVTCKVIVEEDW